MRYIALALSGVVLASACAHAESEPVGGSVSFDVFYQELAPYGDWVTLPPYGSVWRPGGMPPGWVPYTYGQWEYTDVGWLWVSQEPWGWAAFHYGRWGFDPAIGWFWVPGYEWAPALVLWRVGPGVVGWAPLAPGMPLDATAYPFPADRFVFVPASRFVGISVSAVLIPRNQVPTLLHQTTPAPPPGRGRGPRYGGPTPAFVSQHTGRPITPRPIVAAPSPGMATRPPPQGAVPVFRPTGRTGSTRRAPKPGVAAHPKPGTPVAPAQRVPPPPAPHQGSAPPAERPKPPPQRAAPPPAERKPAEEHPTAPAPRPEGS